MDKQTAADNFSTTHTQTSTSWTPNVHTSISSPGTPTPKASTPTPAAASTATPSTAGSTFTPPTFSYTSEGSYDSVAAASAAAAAAAANGTPYSPNFNFLPFLFQNSDIYQAQLLHYNKLISPTRGGGLQSQALPPIVSPSNAHAAPRSRSSSKVSLKDSTASKGTGAGGHGNRTHQNSDKNRSTLTSNKDGSQKMAPKQNAESSKGHTAQKPIQQSSASLHNQGPAHSSSVPSTPHQRARQFSLDSRDPSPSGNHNHSPRSVYSETNGTLPSLRPLPARLGGCQYETSQINSRRRMPYSGGSDRLERLDLRTVKAKLTEDEERKLATDMRELYDRLLPTTAVEDNRKKLVKKLEKIFNDEWPGHDIRAHPFGSSGNLLCSDDSDVDICITTAWPEMEHVCMIADLLARRGMEKVTCISAAKVPIVKIWDPELKLACDMNVNNTLALENTRMIRIYVEIDPRIRQLGMILKHWARRRVINDAAFGGTLSSYTWICMIIAFLQLRDPPVLPAIHQLPYKMPKENGSPGEFADNLKKLRGYGNKNKSSVADLLFEFFRFYGHEFDYQKHVLSVRHGKLLTKKEKNWMLSNNNDLCVEEPFNVSRNLGNTADEFSFRGLHVEIRRAFDLISAGKLDEACEQYVFPKEEEKTFLRPAAQSRPVLLRSASQTHSGRGGRGNHRGGRHNHNFHRGGGGGGGGGSSRRASSSVPTPTYDTNMFMQPIALQQDLAWYQPQHFQVPYVPQDLMAQHFAIHQENLRHMQAYNSAYIQQQQQQNAGQQRNGAGSNSAGPSSSNRSRTNSFDKAPLSAPIAPNLYALYGMNMSPAYYQQANTAYTPYPASPATVVGTTPDFRRSLQRSTGLTDAGHGISGSSLRSQSQPAARSQPPQQQQAAMTSLNTPTVPQQMPFPPRNVNGVPIPSFISDDAADFDETPKAFSESPSEDGGVGSFFAARSTSPTRPVQQTPTLANGIAFGDLATSSSSPGRRRLSSDQLPQTILDRRMRRKSRSPSPFGHSRAFSVGTASAPLTSAPFTGAENGKNAGRPLVVNGSGTRTSAPSTPAEQTTMAALPSEFSNPPALPNPLHIQTGMRVSPYGTDPTGVLQPAFQEQVYHPVSDGPPVIVNGTGMAMAAAPKASDTSFRERVAMMDSRYMNSQAIAQEVPHASTAHLGSAARQRAIFRQPQNGVIAPLDLAIRDKPADGELVSHLSPVYETQAPSPGSLRKAQNAGKYDKFNGRTDSKAARAEPARVASKSTDRSQQVHEGAQPAKSQNQSHAPAAMPQTMKHGPGRDTGHVRGAKSESDGAWQKASKNKKKAGNANIQQQQQQQLHNHGEQPPKHDYERKGG